MADNKIITDEILKKATENILQLMTDNSYKFVPYTQEEIQEVFDLDEVTAQSLSKVINDEFVAKNKVYSNEYTNTLLEKVKAECNQYTVEQIANSGNLKRKIVTSTSDVTDESILYLILTDSTNNIYTQYMLIDGTATPLGTTQVDLSDYLLISDFNTTIADYAKKNETVAQNDVMADLTTLSSNTVLSTQGVSDELDKKVDKTSIVTSVDSTSTDEQIPSAKLLYDNSKVSDVVNLISYVNTDLFDITNATVNVIKSGRHVQLNIQALVFKQDMEGLPNLLILNAIPKEYRPLILTETTMYSTTNNMSGRGFLDTDGKLYNFFYYDGLKGSPKIGGYLFGTFNYISAI